MKNSKKLTVALINVVMEGDYQYQEEIPLGLASIGSFLREHNYNVIFHQCLAGKDDNEINLAATVQADVYGFQLNMVNYLSTRAVIERIKDKNPAAVTVLGGPFLVSLSQDILRNEQLYDFMIVGEGEITMLELLRKMENKEDDFSSVAGLVWRNNLGIVVQNGLRKLIEDLDTLPFPARDFMENARRDERDNGLLESLRMITSRGCVGSCSFCCVNKFSDVQKGKRWRGRSPKHVVDELEYLSKTFNARLFNFSDSSFEDPGELGKKRSREICEDIIKRKIPLSAKIYMRCETMKSDADIELLKLYKQAGVDMIIVGAEAGSDYELRLYEKHATLEDNLRMSQILKELDSFYIMQGFIMFGPNSTVKTLRDNIEYLYKCDLTDNVNLVSNVLMLIRDSKLYEQLKLEGRVIEPENYWDLPKYTFVDPHAKRMAAHWQNVLARYPLAWELNKVQINIGNVKYRMTNPMNAKILQTFKDEYAEFKQRGNELSQEFGKLQYEYFIDTLSLIEKECSDEEIALLGNEFFTVTYSDYLAKYNDVYNSFLDKVIKHGFSLSGLTFKPFYSSMVFEDKKRF